MRENFKDGRNPQDKGDSARHGIPKNATIDQLKKIRASDAASKRKKQLAHWQINMRSGKKTTEEVAATSTASIPNPINTAMGPKASSTPMYDRRRRKDKPPVLLKRFSKYVSESST
jgi:hypothetical protein